MSRRVTRNAVWWRAPTTCFILSLDSGAAKSYQSGLQWPVASFFYTSPPIPPEIFQDRQLKK